MIQSSSSAKALYARIAQFADDTKAENVIVLDMRKVANFCDYFVICSGTSDRHVRGIADHIYEGLAKEGLSVPAIQASNKSDWIVFDLGDIIVHIFHKDLRDFYALEYLWRDAPEVKWQD
jgi:ribosome-associated protein